MLRGGAHTISSGERIPMGDRPEAEASTCLIRLGIMRANLSYGQKSLHFHIDIMLPDRKVIVLYGQLSYVDNGQLPKVLMRTRVGLQIFTQELREK